MRCNLLKHLEHSTKASLCRQGGLPFVGARVRSRACVCEVLDHACHACSMAALRIVRTHAGSRAVRQRWRAHACVRAEAHARDCGAPPATTAPRHGAVGRTRACAQRRRGPRACMCSAQARAARMHARSAACRRGRTSRGARCCRGSATRMHTRRRSRRATSTCPRSGGSCATATCPPTSTRRALPLPPRTHALHALRTSDAVLCFLRCQWWWGCPHCRQGGCKGTCTAPSLLRWIAARGGVECSGASGGSRSPLQALTRGVWLQAAQTRRIQKDSEKRKERNRVAHSAPGTVKVKAARCKKVVAQLE